MQVVSIPPQFHAALEAEPHCLTLRCAIADWFEENGQLEAAECMRWLVGKGEVVHNYRGSEGWAVGVEVQDSFVKWESDNRGVAIRDNRPEDYTVEYAYERILTTWVNYGLKSPACCVGVGPSEESQ